MLVEEEDRGSELREDRTALAAVARPNVELDLVSDTWERIGIRSMLLVKLTEDDERGSFVLLAERDNLDCRGDCCEREEMDRRGVGASVSLLERDERERKKEERVRGPLFWRGRLEIEEVDLRKLLEDDLKDAVEEEREMPEEREREEDGRSRNSEAKSSWRLSSSLSLIELEATDEVEVDKEDSRRKEREEGLRVSSTISPISASAEAKREFSEVTWELEGVLAARETTI
jgi:hypothetical protein